MEKSIFESTHEFFDMWLKAYDATYGRLTGIPAVGPMREKQEKMMKGLPIYANLYTTWIESNVNFQTVFMEAMKRTYEKAMNDKEGLKLFREQLEMPGEQSDILKGDISQAKYKWFYNIWIETYSDTFKEFLKSGHFASDMGKLMSHFIDFQKYNREMTEDNYLKPNNLPTKTDIEEINKELYNLKTMIKDLEGRVREFSEKKDVKKEDIKKELPVKDETKKEDIKKELPVKDETKKEDIKKELSGKGEIK